MYPINILTVEIMFPKGGRQSLPSGKRATTTSRKRATYFSDTATLHPGNPMWPYVSLFLHKPAIVFFFALPRREPVHQLGPCLHQSHLRQTFLPTRRKNVISNKLKIMHTFIFSMINSKRVEFYFSYHTKYKFPLTWTRPVNKHLRSPLTSPCRSSSKSPSPADEE